MRSPTDIPHRHGVVSRRELLAAGLSRNTIARLVRSGWLVNLYRGVYAIGHDALTIDGRRLAAVLACGPTAVLSHRSAAGAWALRPDGVVRWEISVRTTTRLAPDPRILVHRHRTLFDDEITVLHGIPITTVDRTLIDLAGALRAHELRRAIERAEQLELFDLRRFEPILERHRLRPGTAELRALLADFAAHGMTMTRSDLEAAFFQLCLDHGIARPLVNRHAGGREIDFRWPGHALIVEVDGYGTHKTRRAFRDDRARDRAALVQGVRTARFTAYEIYHRAGPSAREIRALLAVY